MYFNKRSRLMVSCRWLKKLQGWWNQARFSSVHMCAYFAQKWKKKDTHFFESKSPRDAQWLVTTPIHLCNHLRNHHATCSINPPFCLLRDNYVHPENTALNDEKKKQTHTLPIRHKRTTDVDPQKACLQVQIAWRVFKVNVNFHW